MSLFFLLQQLEQLERVVTHTFYCGDNVHGAKHVQFSTISQNGSSRQVVAEAPNTFYIAINAAITKKYLAHHKTDILYCLADF